MEGICVCTFSVTLAIHIFYSTSWIGLLPDWDECSDSDIPGEVELTVECLAMDGVSHGRTA